MYLPFIRLVLKLVTNMPLRDKGLCLLKPTPVVGHPACFRLSLSKAAKDVFASEALQCSRCTLEGVGGNGRAGSSRRSQEVWMEPPLGLLWARPALRETALQQGRERVDVGTRARRRALRYLGEERGRLPKDVLPQLRVRTKGSRGRQAWEGPGTVQSLSQQVPGWGRWEMRPKRKAGAFEGQAGPWSEGDGESPAEFSLTAVGPGGGGGGTGRREAGRRAKLRFW